MENPYTQAGFTPEAAFAGAAERFFELLKTFGMPAAGQLPNWSSLAAPLAAQFEQWLRVSQSAGPWFGAGGAASGLRAQPGFAAPGGFSAPAAAAAFGPLPLGPAAAQSGEAQRTWELWGRLAQLQTELAVHWGEIANSAAQRFVARLGSAAGAPATPEQALKLYELWVSCAEEAYAATVHKEDFARLQAELANTSAALLVEQRRHAETLVRAFGLPTRNEVDALYGQVKDLRRQLAELTDRERPQGTRTANAGEGDAPPAPRRRDKPARAHKPARAAAARRSGKRPRARRPRA
jgi:polyhydroxyalkanoate synthesis regulator phasin